MRELLLAAVAVLVMITNANAFRDPPTICIIQSPYVHVRTQPNRPRIIIGSFEDGHRVEFWDKDASGQWYYVIDNVDGSNRFGGWVPSKLLDCGKNFHPTPDKRNYE
jgi:hypothetical protein